jgi:hypothetical protein
MSTYILERTGQRPLKFEGQMLATADGAGPDHNRWNELGLYTTERGAWLLYIQFHTQRPGELGHSEVIECEDLAAVEAELLAYDPCDHVRGFPAYPQFAERQKALFFDVRSRYQALVSELLAQFPEEVA